MLPEKTFFDSTKRRLSRLALLSLFLSCVSIPARRATCADESRLPVEVLPLNLVQEVEIALVKVVHSDVTVLSSGRVALAGWVRGDGVLMKRVSMQRPPLKPKGKTYQRTEVTTHTADLLLKDLVVEPRLELTLTGGGGSDVHSGLTTTEDDEVLLGGDGGAVERGVGGVGLEQLEVAGGDELRGLVLGGGNEVGAVLAPLQVGDLGAEVVRGDLVDHVAGLAVVLGDGAVLVAGDDVL